MKITLSRGARDVLNVILVIAAAVCFFALVNHGINTLSRRECFHHGERIGLPYKYEHGVCWIEIDDDLWVHECEVKYYLEFVNVELIDRSGGGEQQ
jgi:hypothetical protein